MADFIGTSNLLSGTVETIDGSTAVVRLGSGDRCRIGGEGRAAGEEIDLSLRPESIRIEPRNGTAREAARLAAGDRRAGRLPRIRRSSTASGRRAA